MSLETDLAVLLARNATLFTAYENLSEAQINFLTGTIDDPDSFNESGGTTGILGCYPSLNANGSTVYMPCLARLSYVATLGGYLPWKTVTTNYTALPNERIYVNTTSGPITITLPSTGGSVVLADPNNTWDTNNITINGNGRNIFGNATIVFNYSGYEIVFKSKTTSWTFEQKYQYGSE